MGFMLSSSLPELLSILITNYTTQAINKEDREVMNIIHIVLLTSPHGNARLKLYWPGYKMTFVVCSSIKDICCEYVNA